MRILPMGPHAVLIEELGGAPAAWASGLRQLQLPGVIEIVPGAATVLVVCADDRALGMARQRLGEVVPVEPAAGARQHPIEIPVRYDGDDLDAVAAAVGLSAEEVVAAHTAPQYVVAFCGFAPGFGYLRGLDRQLHLARRATPRTRVPAGSVAIAAEYTSVYPRVSPGGWHLLGRTDMVMFDPDRSPPAVFEPGALVRFVAT